jgi:uracil-DNA glycosylase
MKEVGKAVKYRSCHAVLTYHPSFLSRNQHPEIKKAFIAHLSLAKTIAEGGPFKLNYYP